MNKNVVILSASPCRTGNSGTLCDQCMKETQETGHQVEKEAYENGKIRLNS